ncbi:MAG: SPOR domain-containing protein [Chitinophagales bacterium]|nr:SPOR domain-containing protein [Chitinophagales bacterium]
MKLTHLTLTLAFILLLAQPALAQKKEKKQKMSKKEMQASMSSLNTNVENLKSQIANLQAENENLKNQLNKANDQAAALDQEAIKLKNQLTAAQQQVTTAQQMTAAPNGLAFKVQIGAYKNFKISQYFERAKKVETEDIDGYNKYIIGYFSTLEEAEAFEKDVKKMGIQDAWVVPYKNGDRISDEEAEQLLGRTFRKKK